MRGVKNTKENIILEIILGIGICALGIIFVYINLVQYKLGLNADIAAEGLLAREIWESKEWIPKDWYYSTEARVISIANVAALFYGMTKDICLSMGLSCIVGMIFILLCAYFLGKTIGLEKVQKLWLLLLFLLLPNNKVQIELMYIYAGHYAFHVGLYFLTLAYYVALIKKKKIKWHWMAVVFGLHFILGIQGVRGILMITGPLLAVEAVRRVYLLYIRRELKKEDNKVTIFTIGLNVAGFMGGLLPISVGYPLSRNIRRAPQKFLEVVLPDFLSSLNWGGLPVAEKWAYAGCLLLVLCLTAMIIIKGLKKQEIYEQEWVYLNFVMSLFLTVAALTFTTVESSSRYFIVIYFAIAMAITILWKEAGKWIKGCFVTVVLIVLIGNSKGIYVPMLTDESFKNNEYMQICDYLLQEEYENAYTVFDHANTITVMGDGKMQVSAVASMSTMGVNKWLSSKRWYVPNVARESKTAYIVSDYRLEEFEVFLKEHSDTVEFKNKIGKFNIYGSEYNYSNLAD